MLSTDVPDPPDEAQSRRPARSALPAQLSDFVGRRDEIARVKQLVSESRLVTLTGVGGVGKTRLGLRVAAELRRMLVDGVWFVDLTRVQESQLTGPEVRDSDMIAHVVLGALGRSDRVGGSPVESLTSYLLDRRMMLLMDNCEHVGPACTVLVKELLGGCPGVRVLATSREPLAVGGEVLYPVPPLPIPGPGRADLAGCESVALFLSRAQAVVPDFALTDDNRDSVAELCRRLDGLPLAVELAAARVRVLAPQQILDRVSDRFALLSRGRRDAPARQQTLRACVEWSFELCSKPEQLLWARLSVFVGGFELKAVERVCADDVLPAHDLMDVLAALVDKSIVDRIETDVPGRQPRYRMLETLHDYGRERLVEAGDQATLGGRHRDWYQELIASASAEWVSHRQPYWQARLLEEYPNLRAAMEFCLTTPGEAEAVLQIVVALPRGFWISGGMAGEGLGWLDRALAQAQAPTVARARALVLSGGLALHGKTGTTARRLDEGQRLAQRLGDPFSLALACFVLSVAAYQSNDLTAAIEIAERGLSLLPDGPDQSLRLQLLVHLLWAAALARDRDRYRHCYREIQQITEPRGSVAVRSAALLGIGLAAWREGEIEEADRHVREGLRIRQATRTIDLFICGQIIEVLAWTAARQQRYQRAATLLGAAESALNDRGSPISSFQALVADHTICEQRTRDALDHATFTGAFHHGQTLLLNDAIAYALEQAREPTAVAPTSGDTATPLTRREHQIAELIAQGLSNQEIANSLVISPRTAEGHVQNILTKLGFTSRTQVATWITDRAP